MRTFFLFINLIPFFLLPFFSQFPVATAVVSTPAGPLIKHLSSLLKWTKNSPKSSQSDGPVVQFESGYLVETIVEGNAIGVVPYSIRVSHDGELFAVDSEGSNIVRITPPLSQYSRARLVAGSFQGKTGHVDGKPNDARFNHPKGVAMDDKGNVYIADTDNLAIRKVGEGGVTTIAGGKSNVAGYTDGPSEDAKFSADFDVVYVPSTCSLLVVDRGNAALRKISLNQEDCDSNYSSISVTDIVMVFGAMFVGYASCLLHQGFGPAFISKFLQSSASDDPQKLLKEKQNSILESVKEEQVPAGSGWPPFGQMIGDLGKLAHESLSNVIVPLIPPRFSPKKGLTPLKDALKMPEDGVQPQLIAQKQRTPVPVSESWQAYAPDTTEKHSEAKTLKMRSASMKDPSLSSKHRSSKRQEYSEFYGSSEAPHKTGQIRSKAHKERSKHRHRDKSGEVSSGAHAPEPKPGEYKGVNYNDPRFNPYNVGNRYMPDASYRY
ncbi:uncharacterized protein LOC110734021 [Chenopodium quinoa]|uniref:uncharacterized protein LOC110734021 n=1 Tax=Chenopodium quinoa TaxID=63459 RepID=UPI000B786953|nr:uncharacterized protein LOC110734021 [Chenopodium quinoa]